MQEQGQQDVARFGAAKLAWPDEPPSGAHPKPAERVHADATGVLIGRGDSVGAAFDRLPRFHRVGPGPGGDCR
jgi:hypothetical protein